MLNRCPLGDSPEANVINEILDPDGLDNDCDGAIDPCQPTGNPPVEEQADALLIGEESGDNAGQAVSIGDVTGDGWDDLLVGAPE